MVTVRIDAIDCEDCRVHIDIEINPRNDVRWLQLWGDLASACHTNGCRRPSGHQGPHYFNADDAAHFGGVP